VRKVLKLCFVISFLLSVACSGNKKASKSTFTKGLTEYFSKRPPVVGNSFLPFPGVLSSKIQILGPSKKAVEALVEANLASFKGDTVVNGIPGKKYDVTDFGKKCFVEYQVSNLMLGKAKLQGFSFVNEKVTEIVSFSEPADIFGKKVSEVKYKSSVANVANWVKSAKILESFKDVQEYLNPKYAEEIKTAVFILTSNGWVHEQLYSE
jgi:hypothetical protein